MNSTYNETNEYEWNEMQETLNEAYELQEHESQEISGETRRKVRIVTPAVIIRITLAPMRGKRKIFGTTRAVAGAASPSVRQVPSTGSSYVPVRVPDQQTGQTGSGAVFAPQNGSNIVRAATWAPSGNSSGAMRQAGNWVTRQARKIPSFGRRLRKVQVLVDGKPCQSCVRQLAKTVSTVAPKGSTLNVRFTNSVRNVNNQRSANRTSTSTSIVRPTRTVTSRRQQPTTGKSLGTASPRSSSVAQRTTRPTDARSTQATAPARTTNAGRPSANSSNSGRRPASSANAGTARQPIGSSTLARQIASRTQTSSVQNRQATTVNKPKPTPAKPKSATKSPLGKAMEMSGI